MVFQKALQNELLLMSSVVLKVLNLGIIVLILSKLLFYQNFGNPVFFLNYSQNLYQIQEKLRWQVDNLVGLGLPLASHIV